MTSELRLEYRDSLFEQDAPAWVPDEERKNCAHCDQEFTMLTRRRHHCRACGDVFCSDCTNDKMELPAKWKVSGKVRICFNCFASNNKLTGKIIASVERAMDELFETCCWIGLVEAWFPKKSRRILVVGRWHLYFLLDTGKTLKLSEKLHLFHVKRIHANRPTKLCLTMGKQQCVVYSPDAPALLSSIMFSIREITYGWPESHVVYDLCEEMIPQLSEHKCGPAGGFLETYEAFCALYNRPVSEEAIEFILDIVQEPHRILDLAHCPGSDVNSNASCDFGPMLAALRFNTFFRAVAVDELVSADSIKRLAQSLEQNRSLTSVAVTNYAGKNGVVAKLCESFVLNPLHSVQSLDLTAVTLNSKAQEALFDGFRTMRHAFLHLRLVRCGLNSKSIVRLFDEGFLKNIRMSLCLETLDLSENRFDDEGSAAFGRWVGTMKGSSKLKTLRLSRCSANVSLIARPLHFLLCLESLDLSQNRFDQAACQLLCVAAEKVGGQLKELNFSGCRLTTSQAHSLLQALLTNHQLTESKINLADNDLDSNAGSLFALSVEGSSHVHTMDLSGNRLTAAAYVYLVKTIALASQRTLDTLILDNCLLEKGLTARTRNAISLSLSRMVRKATRLRRLSLAGGYRAQVLLPFVIELSANHSLQELNISNNQLGDVLASSVAHALRGNKHLKALMMDGNRLSVSAWQSLRLSLNFNTTLQVISYPWSDYDKAIPRLSEQRQNRLRELLIDVQNRLFANRSNAAEPYQPIFLSFVSKSALPVPTSVTPLMELPEHLTGYAAALAAEEDDQERTLNDTEAIAGGAAAVLAADDEVDRHRHSQYASGGSSQEAPLSLPESPPYSQAAMDTALSRYTAVAEPLYDESASFRGGDDGDDEQQHRGSSVVDYGSMGREEYSREGSFDEPEHHRREDLAAATGVIAAAHPSRREYSDDEPVDEWELAQPGSSLQASFVEPQNVYGVAPVPPPQQQQQQQQQNRRSFVAYSPPSSPAPAPPPQPSAAASAAGPPPPPPPGPAPKINLPANADASVVEGRSALLDGIRRFQKDGLQKVEAELAAQDRRGPSLQQPGQLEDEDEREDTGEVSLRNVLARAIAQRRQKLEE